MNILVFGATGFIGRNIAEYFKSADNKIFVTGNKRKIEDPSFGSLNANLTTEIGVAAVFEKAKLYFGGDIDVVIQTAATTSGAKDTFNKPWYHVTDNAVMNSLILREELNHKVKHHIFFSCTVMYSAQNGKVDENTVINEIQDIYFGVGWTKVYLEKMCKFYSTLTKTKFTVIRHSNIYGPYDKYGLENSHFFGANLTKVLTSKAGDNIVVWGDGQDTRDLLSVEDLCSFMEIVIKQQTTNYELFILGSEHNYTTNEVVSKMIEIIGTNNRILNDLTKPSMKINFTLDCSKAHKLGWYPKTNLEDGIKQTISWYKKFYDYK